VTDIPPPQVPKMPAGSIIYLPFMLADAPRLQLDYLSRHPDVSPAHREAISKWLAGYIARVVAYLRTTYGQHGVDAATILSRLGADRMNEAVADELKKQEGELFTRLEEEMFRDEE
jgi:hypothetical protein